MLLRHRARQRNLSRLPKRLLGCGFPNQRLFCGHASPRLGRKAADRQTSLNNPITIKLYDFDLPENEEEPSTALKVVITFQNCDYILESRRDQAEALKKADDLKIPLPGLAARWPREIELRTEQGKRGNVYIRADLCKETEGIPKQPGMVEDKIKS